MPVAVRIASEKKASGGKKLFLVKGKRRTSSHARRLAMRRAMAMTATKKKGTRKRVMPLPFYAVVEVKKLLTVPTEVRGLFGIITGRVKEDGKWNYNVRLQNVEKSCYLPHSALKRNGKILRGTK